MLSLSIYLSVGAQRAVPNIIFTVRADLRVRPSIFSPFPSFVGADLCVRPHGRGWGRSPPQVWGRVRERVELILQLSAFHHRIHGP
jgi:hypothetical protein